MARKAHCLARDVFGYARHFEHDPARLYDRDPVFDRTFTGTHTGFGRVPRDRLVGEDIDPYLPAALDEPRLRDTRRIDLAGSDPRAFGCDEAVFAVSDFIALMRLALDFAAVLSSSLDSLRN